MYPEPYSMVLIRLIKMLSLGYPELTDVFRASFHGLDMSYRDASSFQISIGTLNFYLNSCAEQCFLSLLIAHSHLTKRFQNTYARFCLVQQFYYCNQADCLINEASYSHNACVGLDL